MSADYIIVTAFKRADDDDGYVLRAYEAEGRRTDVILECSLLLTTHALAFAPFEVKTVKIGDDGTVRETDLLEMSGDHAGYGDDAQWHVLRHPARHSLALQIAQNGQFWRAKLR